jgi:hypothetical protein
VATKTCNAWAALAIAADSLELTAKNAKAYLRSRGGRFNYLWLFQNLRDGIEQKVDLSALRAAAFGQRKEEARQPNWDRIQVLRRLYKDLPSKCSESYIPSTRLASGMIDFQPVAVRHDLLSGRYSLVIPQARRTAGDVRALVPMMIYCARNYLLSDTREQLLPTIQEQYIGIEIPDLGNDSPRDLRSLREAHVFTEGNAERIEAARAEQRLAFFREAWPEAVKRHIEEQDELRRAKRKRNDPWPRGSLFDPK